MDEDINPELKQKKTIQQMIKFLKTEWWEREENHFGNVQEAYWFKNCYNTSIIRFFLKIAYYSNINKTIVTCVNPKPFIRKRVTLTRIL